jgi:ubiquitin carboxyl-terminal hydrolase 22/27/51
MQVDLTQLPADALNGIELYSEDAFSDEKCICVTHKVFAGFLRSDVRCLACNSVSTMKEAFLDISLDLDRNKNLTNPLTLEQSLSRFTQPETLESFHCDVCQERSACTKQLSIDQLPLTLCFHLKRFQHTFTSTAKIETYMPFPLNLDMTPYTYGKSVDTQSQNGHEEATNGSSSSSSSQPHDHSPTGDCCSPHPLYPPLDDIGKERWGAVPRSDRAVYCLYAVVNHVGNMETGHYTSFIRHGEEWYKCDDHHITRTTKKEVLKSRAYLLFYCRSVLEYQE